MKKSYTLSISAKRFWTVFIPLCLLVCIAGGIGGLVIVDKLVMPRIVGISDKGIIETPNIINLTWQTARQRLYDVGLRLKIATREYDEELAKGIVINQIPEAGEKVKKGRHINVVVSKGSEVASVPDVRGLRERAARKKMLEAGFDVVVMRKTYNEKYEKDLVIKTDPARGTITSREVPVVVEISKGARPTHAEVPNIVGDMLSEAREKLVENGLVVGKIDHKSGSMSIDGTVISQSVPPGTSVPLDSPVNIVVAATR